MIYYWLQISWKMQMKLSISGEFSASICVSVLLSLEVFVQQKTAVQSPCCMFHVAADFALNSYLFSTLGIFLQSSLVV